MGLPKKPRQKCPCCSQWRATVERKRRNTRYVNDELNYLTACRKCRQDDFAEFEEQWQSYYSGCM
jgi:C4-type Zn-finger protein